MHAMGVCAAVNLAPVSSSGIRPEARRQPTRLEAQLRKKTQNLRFVFCFYFPLTLNWTPLLLIPDPARLAP